MVPGCDGVDFGLGAGFFLQDDLDGFGPHERLGLGVVTTEIVCDRLLPFGHAGADAAADLLVRDLGEEALDGIEPRRRGWNEVPEDAWRARPTQRPSW